MKAGAGALAPVVAGKESMERGITESDSSAGNSISVDTGKDTMGSDSSDNTMGSDSLGLGNTDTGLEYPLTPDENLAEFVVGTLDKMGPFASYPLQSANWVLLGLSVAIWICILYILITRHGGDDDNDRQGAYPRLSGTTFWHRMNSNALIFEN